MHSYLSFLFPSIFWAYSETWEIANFTGVNPRQPPAYGMKVYVRAYGASALNAVGQGDNGGQSPLCRVPCAIKLKWIAMRR